MDLTVICQACLSQDRSLKPLGEFEKLFKAIFRHSYHVFEMGIKCSDLLLCWECHQIMKNINKFQNKVVEAQLTLNKHNKQHFYNNDIKTLSSLTTQIQQNESITAKQKLEYLNEISIFKVDEGDREEELPEVSEQRTEQGKQEEGEDDTFDADILENLKEEVDFDYDYDILVHITDKTISPNIEIKEKEKLNIARPKKKTKPAAQKKAVKQTCESKVSNKINDLKNDKNKYKLLSISTDYHFKNIWFINNLNLFNIAPGSQFENVLERLPKMNNSRTCTKCNEECYNEKDFTSHMKLHFRKYTCRFCDDDVTYDEDQIISHMGTEHRHEKQLRKCRRCAKRFVSSKEYKIHLKECRVYKCNECTEVFRSKQRIEQHCSKHMTFKCIECNNDKFKNINSYIAHRYLQHNKKKTEAAYCVECDKHFDSDVLMQHHLRYSRKHVKVVPKKSFPCSECSNVYDRPLILRYHYNKVHVGITKFYCENCNKYFMTSYKLKMHNQITHDKIPRPKNKLCPHCGRGFSTNKILRHHIYTHTGERPHECSYCDAKFTQKYRRDMHMKNIHKHGINK